MALRPEPLAAVLPQALPVFTPAQATRCDAHALWAIVTRLRGFSVPAGVTPDTPVPLLVEFRAEADAPARAATLAQVTRSALYTDPAEPFFTGQLALGRLAALVDDPAVRGWRIGLPAIPMDTAGGPAAAAQRPAPAWVGGPAGAPVLGIIDHAFAVAHVAFRRERNGRTTRIGALWDQDPQRLDFNDGHHWAAAWPAGYGGQIDAATIDMLIAAHGDDESRLYRALQYEPAQRRVGHGTHVLDIAAGNPDPLSGARDAAARAHIVAVQLPHRPAKDASGASLCVNVLDALRFIDARVEPGRRIVVNLSDGAYGGPHDGGSMLERAIDDLLDRRAGRLALVLAAGNAHEERLHARVDALPPGQVESFRWRLRPDDSTDSFVEIWFDRRLAPGEASCELVLPDGSVSVLAELGDGAVFVDAAGAVVAAVLSGVDPPNAAPADGGLRRRSMFLVATAPTRPGAAASVPHGVWTLRVRHRAEQPVAVDVWVERDNPVLAESGPRRQSILVEDRFTPGRLAGTRTLGSLAGSARASVIGGRYARGGAFSGDTLQPLTTEARYSSRGPGRAGSVSGPDALRVSDESPVMHGVRAAATLSGTTFRMDGTSVAAPQSARRLLNGLPP